MKSVYLILDMQNDLVGSSIDPMKSPTKAEANRRGIVQRTAEAIQRARSSDVQVGFVRVAFQSNYANCPSGSPVFSGARTNGLFRDGSPGTEVIAELQPAPTDWLITKSRVSPFYATNLETYLRAAQIGRIYCSGVSTQAVVQATVRDAHDRDYEVVLLEDCCAAHSAEEHQNSVQSLGRFCRIASSQDVDFQA